MISLTIMVPVPWFGKLSLTTPKPKITCNSNKENKRPFYGCLFFLFFQKLSKATKMPSPLSQGLPGPAYVENFCLSAPKKCSATLFDNHRGQLSYPLLGGSQYRPLWVAGCLLIRLLYHCSAMLFEANLHCSQLV